MDVETPRQRQWVLCRSFWTLAERGHARQRQHAIFEFGCHCICAWISKSSPQSSHGWGFELSPFPFRRITFPHGVSIWDAIQSPSGDHPGQQHRGETTVYPDQPQDRHDTGREGIKSLAPIYPDPTLTSDSSESNTLCVDSPATTRPNATAGIHTPTTTYVEGAFNAPRNIRGRQTSTMIRLGRC